MAGYPSATFPGGAVAGVATAGDRLLNVAGVAVNPATREQMLRVEGLLADILVEMRVATYILNGSMNTLSPTDSIESLRDEFARELKENE